MKRLVLLLALPAAVLTAAELSAVQKVYLMPMYRGLDQYLANRLTNEKVFQVVTDPRLADAVFTDRIGQGFQIQLENFLPVVNPEPVAAANEAKDSKSKATQEQDKTTLITDTVNKLDNPALNSSFGRGKGTIFLVDMKSRQVIWSTFEPAPDTVGKEMHRTSTDVVNRLMKDMGLQKKK
jgi:hypothetical protein